MAIPIDKKRDLNRADRQSMIDAGTDFWCTTCFYTLPVEYLSEDGEHCIDCYQVLHEKTVYSGDEDDTEPYAKIAGSNSSDKPKRGRGRPKKSIPINKILESGKTQKQLADETGVSQSTISRRQGSAQGVLAI